MRFLTALSLLFICSAAAQEGVVVTSPNPLADLDLEGLEATRSLPLFTPSRTAPFVPEPMPETEVIYAPPPPTPPTLELVGIITSGSTEIALLRDPSSGQFHRLSGNDQYGGWSLRIVDARTVEFFNGDQVQTLRMFEEFDTLDGTMGLQPGMTPGLPPEYLPPDPVPEYLPSDPNAVAPPE